MPKSTELPLIIFLPTELSFRSLYTLTVLQTPPKIRLIVSAYIVSSEFEPDKLEEAVRLVKSGEFITQSRSMLDIVCGKNKYLALNDIVIQRNTSGTADFTSCSKLTGEAPFSNKAKYSIFLPLIIGALVSSI